MKNFSQRRSALILLFLFCTQHAVYAADSVAYTISDVVSMSLKENTLLLSEDARIKEKSFAKNQIGNWAGPSLELAGGRRKDELTSGPRFEASISQPFPIAGKKTLQGRILELESESWQIQRGATEREITLDVIQLCVEYSIHRRLADFVGKRQKRFALIKSYMEGRVFPSPQKKAEQRIVQNRLKGLLAEAIQTQAAFKGSLEKLRLYAPFESGAIPDIQVPWFSGSKNISQTEWKEKAFSNNPDLKLKNIAIQSAEAEKSLASKNKWPDPHLLASYEQAKATEKETNTGIGLGFEFQSWNGNRSGLKSASQRKIAEEKIRDYQQLQLASQLPRAVIEYEAARSTVQEYPEKSLDEFDAQLRESEEGFRKGQVDLLTFLELDSSATDAYTRAVESQMNLIEKIADIYRLSGEQNIVGQLNTF